MSTEIRQIEGTCHDTDGNTGKTIHKSATLYITRFFNGEQKGSNIQLTVSASNEYGTSYIHLTKEQCIELASVLLECFDYQKYPSD